MAAGHALNVTRLLLWKLSEYVPYGRAVALEKDSPVFERRAKLRMVRESCNRRGVPYELAEDPQFSFEVVL
jgi:hypothetical protein